VLEYARRFENLQGDLENALAELRDKSAGRLTIGANESSTLYLLDHIEKYRRRYPKDQGADPAQPVEQDSGGADRRRPGAGHPQLRSRRRAADFEGDLHDHLAFITSPDHRFAARGKFPSPSWAMETFIAHNVVSPYRRGDPRIPAHKVPLNMDLEMPTVEAIRKMVQRNEGVAFLPRMCVERGIKPASCAK
jgi:DNA-binding transcriptional LysR family regulator